MDIPNSFYRTAIKGLITDGNGRFLLCKEKNGFWDFPGGAMDFGEMPEETLKRELIEETGLKITKMSKKPKYLLVFKNIKGYWSTQIFFETEVENLEIRPSNECVEVKFFDKEGARKENLYPSVFKLLEIME